METCRCLQFQRYRTLLEGALSPVLASTSQETSIWFDGLGRHYAQSSFCDALLFCYEFQTRGIASCKKRIVVVWCFTTTSASLRSCREFAFPYRFTLCGIVEQSNADLAQPCRLDGQGTFMERVGGLHPGSCRISIPVLLPSSTWAAIPVGLSRRRLSGASAYTAAKPKITNEINPEYCSARRPRKNEFRFRCFVS